MCNFNIYRARNTVFQGAIIKFFSAKWRKTRGMKIKTAGAWRIRIMHAQRGSVRFRSLRIFVDLTQWPGAASKRATEVTRRRITSGVLVPIFRQITIDVLSTHRDYKLPLCALLWLWDSFGGCDAKLRSCSKCRAKIYFYYFPRYLYICKLRTRHPWFFAVSKIAVTTRKDFCIYVYACVR